ncbi:MAG: hypothetical protein JRC90_09470 [Deltaproteobacteria bacterium]|nr:hypothetical protein [Deltaproteobacteria bacterium]
MKVICHEDFKESYCFDPAAADGRIEAVIEVIESKVEFIDAIPADEEDILACHTDNHVEHVRRQGLYNIAALAASEFDSMGNHYWLSQIFGIASSIE